MLRMKTRLRIITVNYAAQARQKLLFLYSEKAGKSAQMTYTYSSIELDKSLPQLYTQCMSLLLHLTRTNTMTTHHVLSRFMKGRVQPSEQY